MEFRVFRILCLLYIYIICTMDLHFVNAEVSENEQSIMDAAKHLAEMMDDVRENRQRIEMLEKAVLGKVSSESLDEESVAEEPRMFGPAKINITYLEGDEVECRVEHGWENVSQWLWVVDLQMVPDNRYKQVSEDGYFSIIVPGAIFKRKRIFSHHFSLIVEVEDVEISLSIGLPQSNVFSNNTDAGSFIQEMDIFTFWVSPSKNIGYTPGDQVVLTFEGFQGNDSAMISWEFYAMNGTTPVFYDSYGRSNVINITSQFKSNERDYILTIDTTSMLFGGIVSITEWSSKAETGLTTVQAVHLHLTNTESSIPPNSVAIRESAIGERQTLSSRSTETTIVCAAIGNPTPEMEFLVEGRPISWAHSHWSFECSSYIEAFVPSNTTYDQVTCRAASGNAVEEMSIKLIHTIYVIGELTSWRLSHNTLEVTCAMSAKQPPQISFYLDNYDPNDLLSAQDDGVEITSTSNQRTTVSKLFLNISKKHISRSVICVGESGGKTGIEYINVSY